MHAEPTQSPVLLFGEVLFDHFPDEAPVLGGAPFNVTWGLRALGEDPVLVSRIGNDADGNRVRATMEAWKLDVRGLQTDPELPTGSVTVLPETTSGPGYEIPPDQAWDRIATEAALEAARSLRPEILYHGTLALRSPRSREAWSALADREGIDIFVDLNLRPPWWTPELVERVVVDATWIKLNRDELARVEPGPDPERAACSLFARLPARTLFVTLGAHGALAVDGEGVVHSAPPSETSPVVDTVGAGDAFTAVALFGIQNGWSLDEIVQRAVAFADRICRHRGATPGPPDRFHPHRALWSQPV